MSAAGDPVYIADTAAIEDATTGKPLVRLVANAAQSLNDNTSTAITFAAEDIDTHGFHSTVTNTSRVTPTVAGYYRVRGTVVFGSRTDYSDVNVWIRKNGVTNMAPASRCGYSGITTTAVETGIAEVIVDMNGTTDYVEVVANQNNLANVAVSTNQSSQFSSALEVEYLRPL